MSMMKHAFYALIFARDIRLMETAFDRSDLRSATWTYESAVRHGNEANNNRIASGCERDFAIDDFLTIAGAKVNYRSGKISKAEYTKIWNQIERKRLEPDFKN